MSKEERKRKEKGKSRVGRKSQEERKRKKEERSKFLSNIYSILFDRNPSLNLREKKKEQKRKQEERRKKE